MEKKYKTEPEGNMLRIIALKDFSDVKKGQLGGLIEKEDNLSQIGDCWIYVGAQVYGNARVFGNAEILGGAYVSDNAQICGDAYVGGNARVYGDAKVFNNAYIHGNATVCDNAQIYGYSEICESATIYDNARVYGEAQISGFAKVFGEAKVFGRTRVYRNAKIGGDAKIWSINYYSYITSSIKDSKDYVILESRNGFCIFSREHLPAYHFSISGENYVRNIKTIRQLYGEEI